MNKHMIRALCISFLFSLSTGFSAQSEMPAFSRDLQVDIAVNQVGFVPEAAKLCVVKQKSGAEAFKVIRTTDLTVVFSDSLTKRKGDFGTFLRGDFSAVKQPGTYYIEVKGANSSVTGGYDFQLKAQ